MGYVEANKVSHTDPERIMLTELSQSYCHYSYPSFPRAPDGRRQDMKLKTFVRFIDHVNFVRGNRVYSLNPNIGRRHALAGLQLKEPAQSQQSNVIFAHT